MLLLWLVFLLQKVPHSSQSEQGRHRIPETNLLFLLPVTLQRNLHPLSAPRQPLGFAEEGAHEAVLRALPYSVSSRTSPRCPDVVGSLNQYHVRPLL